MAYQLTLAYEGGDEISLGNSRSRLGAFSPYSWYPYVTPYLGRRIMATVNRNMFGANITEPPGGAQLMVLPLNLIAEIVSHVRELHTSHFPVSNGW